MIYAEIKESVVVNVVVADAQWVEQQETEYIKISEGAGIGWTYDNKTGEFTPPELQVAGDVTE